jgi:hypothetical protein
MVEFNETELTSFLISSKTGLIKKQYLFKEWGNFHLHFAEKKVVRLLGIPNTERNNRRNSN